ncbi:MAG: class I SAM-dependent methyltransferase [Actinomycetota bacterium]
MSVRELDRIDPPVDDPGGPGGPDHPMRRVTLQVAFEPEGWTPERRAKVADLFDSLAGEWHTRYGPGRHRPLDDALDRGDVDGAGLCLELGSGVGLSTALLAERFDAVHALDLSREMLRRSPAEPGPRVCADSWRLPYPDGAVSTLVLQNMLLFPFEVDRVLAPGGALVWVNTSAEFTPIHLTAAEVHRALPGSWDVVASSAGRGTWAVARRMP